MDKRSKHLTDYISKAIVHPDVSGFEALELLDVRSRLALREALLDEADKALLEDLNRQLLQMSGIWLERISEVAGLAEMRRRAHILPSHWWWYLDEIASAKLSIKRCRK
jgi:hypothetical protein